MTCLPGCILAWKILQNRGVASSAFLFPGAHSKYWCRGPCSMFQEYSFSFPSLAYTSSCISECSVIYYILNSLQDAHISPGSIVLSVPVLFLFICISSIIINYFTQGPEENLKRLYLSIRIFESPLSKTQLD